MSYRKDMKERIRHRVSVGWGRIGYVHVKHHSIMDRAATSLQDALMDRMCVDPWRIVLLFVGDDIMDDLAWMWFVYLYLE